MKQSIEYVGVTLENMNDPYIKNKVFDLACAHFSRRILKSRNWSYSFEQLPTLNSVPVLKITVQSKLEDEWCSRCSSFGCPGGC